MTRREARELAMQIIFAADFNKISIEDAKNVVLDLEEETTDLDQMLAIYNDNKEQVDELIASSLVNYTMERLNLTDKAIIRIATSELLGELPKKIVINEALEITKKYSDAGDHKAVGFNNKLLDRIASKLGK